MNPDQNRSGVSLSSLLNWGVAASVLTPTICFVAIIALVMANVGYPTLILSVVACAIVVALVVLITHYLYVQRRLKGQLEDLMNVCRDYVGGDHSVRAAVAGEDELAHLANSLNSILDNQSPSSVLSVGSVGSDAAALQAQIEKLLQEVSAVGDGDLRVQAEVTPDTLGVLADSFNYMIEELAKVVGRVQSTAVQVTNATRRILDRSAELAQASETQVKQIAQTTEAVEALAVFIQNVARNAQLSVDVAQEALRSANTGQQAVRQTIEGMMLIRENVQETAKKIKRLGERSNEIGEIVRIIEDIADQTNLLALNAAIQSAMAGEHGRGFAVVADEIRLLAERSTESTKRIATLVKSIQGDTYEAVVAMEDSTQEVVKGSQLADDAGRSLNSIYSAVERQAQMIENIARAANEQTSVSEAVAVAMGRISEITRQTDAGTQEAAVSVSYLAELSEQLRSSVSTFRLPDRANDMLGSFGNAQPPVSEFSVDRAGQMFGGLNDGAGWGHALPSPDGNSFPPLPEPGNTGNLISSLSANPGQYSFSNGAGFANIPSSGIQAPLAVPGASFNNQFNPSNGFFNNQVDFGELGSFDGQQQFAQNPGVQPGGFNPAAGYAPQGQNFFPNSGLLPSPVQQPGQHQQQQQHNAQAQARWPHNGLPPDQRQ